MNEVKPKSAPGAGPAGDKEIEEGKMYAAIGYISILFLVPLLAAKDNAFARFHAKQGIVLTTVAIVAVVVLLILMVMFSLVPVLGWAICVILYLVVMAVCIGWSVLAIMGLVKALRGEYWKMPLFGGLAEKTNI